MSLYVTITRKPNPLWRSGEQIPLDEWRRIVADDGEFRRPSAQEIAEAGGFGKQEDAIWQGHPEHPAVWFIWDSGQIDVNLPDEFTLRKMARVANLLAGKVISEQGELFDDQGASLGLHDMPDDPTDPKPPRVLQVAEIFVTKLVMALGVCMVLMLVYVMFRVWTEG